MADNIRQIRVRRDRLANWTGVVPANGEPIAITDGDGRATDYKIGDGVIAQTNSGAQPGPAGSDGLGFERSITPPTLGL